MKAKILYLLILITFITINLDGQVYFNPDRHSTNSFDGWVSCTEAPSPNTSRPNGHWIMYDLGQRYLLGASHIWNINDPDNLDAGIKEMAIDYSDDGTNWTTLGIFNMDRSDGSLFYNGTVGPHFVSTNIQYILFTALDNYGASCSGFSEIKITVIDPLLPLSLVDFNVECLKENNNKITWTTEQVKNIKSYEVQRSTDTKEWITIHKESEVEDNNEKIKHQTEDIVFQNNYYRLKITDDHDLVTYSDIERTDCNYELQEINIYPNPSVESSNISFYSKQALLYEFSLYDINGKLIIKKQSTTSAETTTITIETKDLVPGEYLVNIKTGKDVLTKKLIVL